MTQPPLSRQIQLLEYFLGVSLLERTSRLVRLTPAGQVFLIEARRIMKLAESATLAARRLSSGDGGRISIGFTAVSGYRFLPQILTAARARLPNIEVELHEIVTGAQVDALLSGHIDIGFIRPPVSRPEFETLPVLSEPLLAALPTGDPLLAQATVELGDFDGRALIMYSREGASYFHNMLLGLFNAAGVTPLYMQYVVQIHSMLGMVQAGLGGAIVPAAAADLHFQGVHFRPLATVPERPAKLDMAWRRDNANPVLQAVLDLCVRCGETVGI